MAYFNRVNDLQEGNSYISNLPFYPEEIKLPSDDNFRENRLIPSNITHHEGHFWTPEKPDTRTRLPYTTGHEAYKEVKMNDDDGFTVIETSEDSPELICRTIGGHVEFKLSKTTTMKFSDISVFVVRRK